MAHYESPLSVTVKGAAAGLVGTAVLTIGMSAGPRVMQGLGLLTSEPPASQQEEPTAKLAEKVAEGVLETPIEEDTKRVAGQAIHWGYGAAWGAFYGIVQSSLRLPYFLHGTIFGMLVATVASTLVPAIGVAPPPTKQPVAISAMQMVLHLLYGWTTALTFRVLSRDS